MAEVSPLIETGTGTESEKKAGCSKAKVATVTCGVCCLCYIAVVILLAVGGLKVAATISHPENSQVFLEDGVTKKNPQMVDAYEWWPACTGTPPEFTNCGSECCNCKERDAFREYAREAPYKRVNFSSREGEAGQEVVNLTGYWLPADPSIDTGAVVIVVHGLGGSINDFRPALISYLVRVAGFSAFMPNIRAHGSSQVPEHGARSWGWDYPNDVTGAWDYVLNDPDHVMGGPKEAGKIGIMGMSMGGFVAAAAFGLEHKAAALWLDGALFQPIGTMHIATEFLFGPLAPVANILFVPPAFFLTKNLSGVDLSFHTPAKTLPTGPETRRPVMVMQSPDDVDVPGWNADKYLKLFDRLGDRYVVNTTFDLGGVCDCPHKKETHNMLQWLHPEEYRLRICKFFSETLLGQSCNESTLTPSYE